MLKILLLFLFFIYSDANTILTKSPHISDQDIKFYIDKSNKLEIEDILNKKLQGSNKKINLGHIPHNVWIKIELLSKKSNNYIFDYGKYLVDYLDVYFIKNNKIIKSYKTGSRRASNTKAISNSTFVFPFELKKNESLTIFLKIKSSKMISSHYKVEEKEVFKNRVFLNYIYSTSFFTTLFVIMLINIIIYFINKKSIFKDYIYYLLGTIYFWFMFTGYSACFLFKESAFINHFLFYISGFLYFVFYVRYSIRLLKFDYYFKYTSNTLKILAYRIFPILILIRQIYIDTYNEYLSLVSMLIHLCAIIILIAIIILSIGIQIKKTRIPKLISIIWLAKSIFLVIFLINIRFSFYDMNKLMILIQIFIIVETIFMSVLLAYHLKFFEKRNKRLKEFHKKYKELSLENYQLTGIENVLKIIVHQWKQPLNVLNSITLSIETRFTKGNLEEKFLLNQLNEIEKQTEYMNDTLNSFFNYLKTKKIKEEFCLYDTLIESLNLVSNSLDFLDIEYIINCNDKRIQIQGYKKEYIQTILILINNSIEAFKDRNPLKKEIRFYLYRDRQKRPTFAIKDNAGGIKIKPLELIFLPKVSTKDCDRSGFGLFIAKNIIENMQKKIHCKNLVNGAKFKIVG